MSDLVVASGVADVRREPSDESELITQALMNMPAYTGEERGDWAEVKLVDYVGWMRLSDLAEPIQKGFCKVGGECATPLPMVAVITDTRTPLYATAEDQEAFGEIYLTTILPLLDTTRPARVQVALPGERTAWLERTSLEMRQQKNPYPRRSVEEIIASARRFLTVPYHWGGVSWAGIDCSGFMQLNYRHGGCFLPRDADQQDGFLYHAIEQANMRAGDLIFFGKDKIAHVGMALNDHEYIHAEGREFEQVIISSFNRADEHYNVRLGPIVWSIKRVIE